MLIASIYLLPSLRTPWQACPVSWGLAVTSRTWPRSTERCTPASPRCPRTSSGVWSTSRSAAKCTASSSGNTERPGPGGWVSYLTLRLASSEIYLRNAKDQLVVDTTGSAVSSLYTWQDGRCDPGFLASLPRPCSHLGLSTGYGCATMFWLLRNRPEYIQKFDRWALSSESVGDWNVSTFKIKFLSLCFDKVRDCDGFCCGHDARSESACYLSPGKEQKYSRIWSIYDRKNYRQRCLKYPGFRSFSHSSHNFRMQQDLDSLIVSLCSGIPKYWRKQNFPWRCCLKYDI